MLITTDGNTLVAIWLGMAKAGVSTALVNVNTKGPALAHAIRTALAQSEGQVVVVDRSLADVLDDDVLAELPDAVSSTSVFTFFFVCLLRCVFRFVSFHLSFPFSSTLARSVDVRTDRRRMRYLLSFLGGSNASG